jgi:hypothetical protein
MDPVPEQAGSPLMRLHRDQEARWREFIDRHFPGGRLLRWGPQHRVFHWGERVVKVEWDSLAADNPSRGLAYEFSLLQALDGRATRLCPAYKVIDGTWCVLEMDWVEGDYLDDLIVLNRAREVSVLRLVSKLFRVSLAGVIYKQLRGRHVIRRATGELEFIDFGHSSHAAPVIALWRNFAPLAFSGGSLHWSRLVGLVREILRHREHLALSPSDGAAVRATQSWRGNERRTPRARAANLASHPGDALAAQHFTAMEECLREARESDPQIGEDFIKFQFADYGMAGSRDWGFIWDYLTRRVDFAGKTVVDLSCGMGGVGAYARLDGASQVVSYDTHPFILQAARHFSEALGFTDNAFFQIDKAKLDRGEIELAGADIVTALSARLNTVPRARLLDVLTRYPVILWQTADAEAGRNDLMERGYQSIEILLRADIGQHILYAADKRT